MAKTAARPLPRSKPAPRRARPRLTEEQLEEIELRRKAIAESQAARDRERRAAWEEHQRERREAEARATALPVDPEYAAALQRAKERAEKERNELHRRSFDKELRARYPESGLETRFRKAHADVDTRLLGLWARLQEALAGADVLLQRTAAKEMAQGWRDRDARLAELKAASSRHSSKRADASAVLENQTAKLKERLALLEKSRNAARKPTRRRKRAPARD